MTTYQPQTNGQVEWFHRTIISTIRTYAGDHPKSWDMYTDSITFAYKFQPQECTAIAPFDLVISRPLGPIALEAQQPEPSSATAYKSKWKPWIAKALKDTKGHLTKAQELYKRNFDRLL